MVGNLIKAGGLNKTNKKKAGGLNSIPTDMEVMISALGG